MAKFEHISEHIRIMHAEHETDRPILAAVAGSRRTLLIDGGASGKHAAEFRAYLAEEGCSQPDLMVLTHWHWDHSFGSAAWGIPVIAHRETAAVLRSLQGRDWSDQDLRSLVDQAIISENSATDIRNEYGDDRLIQIVQPEILFEDGLVIDLGGVTVEIRHVGGDHASDSCYVYIKEDRVLHLGDALGPSVYGGPRTYTSGSFLRLLELLNEYDAKTYIESHGVPLGKEAFFLDIREWEALARIVHQYGNQRAQVEEQLKAFFKADELTGEQSTAVDYFMAGFRT